MAGKQESFYLAKLEWLGPILVRGLRLMPAVEGLEREFSFSQTLILMVLLNKDSVKMNELARMLGLSRANATGLVDRLEARGIVERRHSTEDRRVVLVSLTRKGRRTAAKLNDARRRGLARMMRRVPPKNLAVFIETLEQMAMGLAETQSDLLTPPKA